MEGVRHSPLRQLARHPDMGDHPTKGLNRIAGCVQIAAQVASIAKGVFDVGKVVAPIAAGLL